MASSREPQARNRARASSIPGSVSMMVGFTESCPCSRASHHVRVDARMTGLQGPITAGKEDGMHIRIKYCGE